LGVSSDSINLSFILEQIINEPKHRRKTWEHFGKFRVPVSYDRGREIFVEMLAIGMIRAFRTEQLVQFKSLVYQNGNDVEYYTLASHHRVLTDTLNNMVMELQRDREAAVRSWYLIKEDFTVYNQCRFTFPLNCHEFRLDTRSRTVSIEFKGTGSTQTQDYHFQLATTSEILEYSAALSAASYQLPLHLGDAFFIKYPAWIRFLAKYVDTRLVHLGLFLVNGDDPEEWDFINPRFEYDGS